jgi:hemerythrin
MALQWTEEMSVGVAALDQDHKELIALINAIAESGPSFAEVFSRLLDYVGGHLDREEAYLDSIGYPDYDNHTSAHDALTARMATLMRDHADDALARVDQDIAEFLYDWLKTHIMIEDKKYATFAAGK